MDIVLAPMAGGPGTAELCAAVCDAGGLGFLAAGYKTVEQVAAEMDAVGGRRYGVNVFCPPDATPEPFADYAARIGADPAAARRDDDGWGAKLELLRARPPAVVSFVFGCPPREVIESLPSEVWVTVTKPSEAEAAVAAGADALVAQGTEAGGHRGGFTDDHPGLGLLALLQQLPDVPVVATGGIATAAAARAARAAGATAVAAGTAFMLCPEAGTRAAHRAEFASGAPTVLTRAITGRTARAIENAFIREHDGPAAFPEVHHLTKSLGVPRPWAGQAYPLAREEPAAAVVQRLT